MKKTLFVQIILVILAVSCGLSGLSITAAAANYSKMPTASYSNSAGGSTTLTTGDKTAMVIVYGNIYCTNTQAVISDINKSDWGKSGDVKLVFADARNNSKANVATFAKKYGGNFSYCYDLDDVIYYDMWSYARQSGVSSTLTYPVVVVFTPADEITYISTGETTASKIYEAIKVFASIAKPEITTAAAGNGDVYLEWSAVKNADKYEVYTYLNKTYTLYKSTTGTSLTVSGLKNGTKYGFVVKASVDGIWTSYTSNDIVYATPVNKPVASVYEGNGRVKLTWTTISNASRYSVYTYLNGKYTYYGSTTATSCYVKNLTNGTKYGFLVRAYVNEKWTSYNIYDVVYATPVDKPVISSAAAGNGKVRLSWTKVSGATSYGIYTYSGGKYTYYGSTTNTACYVKNLTNGTQYGFLVRAYVNKKWTDFNSYDLVYSTPVNKPVITSATAGNGKVALKWDAVKGATRYGVYIYSGGIYTYYGSTSATSCYVRKLVNGSKYGFLVRAYVNGKWTTYNAYDLVYATPKA